MESADLEKCFEGLATEARELYLDVRVPVLEKPPKALEFLRDMVMPNKPVIIHDVISDWPALHTWTNQYLRETIGHKVVTVAVTPNGYADAVYKDRFVMPEERMMTFSSFLDILEKNSETGGIYYIQKQNSSFTDEFAMLVKDADTQLSWASEAFGKLPDAVNFWMGDARAVTSMHKDHYENLYSVVSGSKTFTLIPPTDQPFVPYEEYQAARYKERPDGCFDIVDDKETGKVPWIPVDPLYPDLERYPAFGKARAVTVTVRAGETLYLPSLWFHHVQQSHGCIAVNFWYDMEFDIKYSYYKFVENIMKKANR